MKAILSEKAPAPIGPYSQAIKTGNLLFISGQIAIDQATERLITEDIAEETHQVMRNIGYILEAAGLSYASIVKTSIFIKDMGNFKTINEIYGQYFGTLSPARETVEVSALPKNVNIEISCIAEIN
jgi:2-iminobutanoate/2-iminopropanoate deaminase